MSFCPWMVREGQVVWQGPHQEMKPDLLPVWRSHPSSELRWKWSACAKCPGGPGPQQVAAFGMVWGFDIPIPSANAPSPYHCSWKKIPKPLFAGAPSLPLVFHSEHLRKDSSLLQVSDTWVSLLLWASNGVSAQAAAVKLFYQLLHRHTELSFKEEDKAS